MNIIIKNRNRVIDNAQIEVLKTLTGEFERKDLEEQLVNLTFNKVIIDITAIKNYYDPTSLFYFLSYFDVNKVILLLDDSPLVNSNAFLTSLIDKGYYNFTRNTSGINYLIDHPNKYEDVVKYKQVTIQSAFNPIAGNLNETKPSSSTEQVNYQKSKNQKVIGIQNLTEHAGSTTLMYMMVKQLLPNYKVKGIEMMKQDSLYFRDNNILYATSLEDLKMRLSSIKDLDVIIIDLNDIDGRDICDEILFLVDPGIVKLNKLLKGGSIVYERIQNGKVVLNRSAILQQEVNTFEYETKLKVFLNIPNINDRKDNNASINALLVKLGFNKQSGHGLFSSFK